MLHGHEEPPPSCKKDDAKLDESVAQSLFCAD